MDYLQYIGVRPNTRTRSNGVLNLIINGLPSIHESSNYTYLKSLNVLNLIINGLPSIPVLQEDIDHMRDYSFKPYYKWITFNTTITIKVYSKQ